MEFHKTWKSIRYSRVFFVPKKNCTKIISFIVGRTSQEVISTRILIYLAIIRQTVGALVFSAWSLPWRKARQLLFATSFTGSSLFLRGPWERGCFHSLQIRSQSFLGSCKYQRDRKRNFADQKNRLKAVFRFGFTSLRFISESVPF